MVQPKRNESVEEDKNPPPVPPIVEDLFDKGVKKGENLEQLLDNYNCEELASLKEAFENFGKEEEPPHENGSAWNNIKGSFNSVTAKINININAYFEDDWTPKGFLIGSIITILVVIIIVISLSMMQNENDMNSYAYLRDVKTDIIEKFDATGAELAKIVNDVIEPFDTVSAEMEKIGNDAKEAINIISQELMSFGTDARMELKKVGNEVVEAFNTVSEELRFTKDATEIFNEVNKEMTKIGNDATEAFNDASVELQKLSNDAIESFTMALEKSENDAKETFAFGIPTDEPIIDEPMAFGYDAAEAYITGNGKLHFFGNEAIETLNMACGKIENFCYDDIKAFEAASMEFEIKLKIKFE